MPTFVLSTTGPYITAELIETLAPKPVRLFADLMPLGVEYRVEGVAADGSTWQVPGGVGVVDGPITLIDNRAALNTPVTYRLVLSNGTTYESLPVTVPFVGPQAVVLQTLDGRELVAPLLLKDSGFPLSQGVRSATFDIPGRRTPVVRWDTTTRQGSTFTVFCSPAQSAALAAVLAQGAPLVYRAVDPIRDLAPVEIIHVTSAKSTSANLDGDRRWELEFLFVEDPEPSTPVTVWDWDDFDAFWEGQSWDDFDTFFAASDWTDFDTQAWE
jgi:hypothetical protein